MKRFNHIFLGLVLVISFASCKKYLDIVPDDIATLDIAFDNRNNALNYLFTCYSYMQTRENFTNNPGWTTSGELVDNTTGAGNWAWGNPTTWRYLRGLQTPEAPLHDDFASLYQAIRKCNTFLDNINRPVDLTASEKERWIAEVKFVKAYYYFLLVRQYGPVPIVKENMPISTSTEEARVPRNPSDEVFKYIVELLDQSAQGLPSRIEIVNQYGRATRLMALALKAKVLVTQASPLFNGDAAEAQLKGPDGKQLFPPTFDVNKWKIAADACKVAVQAAHDLNIYLYRNNPTSVIPDAIRQQFSIQDPFSGPQALMIPENIWPGNVSVGGYLQYTVMPNASTERSNPSFEGTTQVAVPLAIAELFYTKNGVPINEDKDWNYGARYSLTTPIITNENKYYIKDQTTVQLHLDREPRFYADLAFNGGIWYGGGREDSNPNNLYYVNYFETGHNDLTGYWAKKLVPYKTGVAWSNTSVATYYPPVMRLADLYLLYAEALNEANNGPTTEAFAYIDSVRARAGLNGVVASWGLHSTNPGKPTTQTGFRSIVHQERRIELCFEGETGWDLRRWKEYAPMFAGQPVRGWNGFRKADDPQMYYQFYEAFVPYMSAKDYFWPISTSTLINNNKLVQNIGW